MAKKSAVRVTPSTGNVFRDLGFSKEESEHLLVRADLMIQVQKTITSTRLTQAEAARVLRVTQPRVSDLLRGHIDLFSTDALIEMLARLGVGVRLVVRPSRSKKVARAEGLAVNQLVNVAPGRKVSAPRTEEYFAERAAKGVIKKALQVLERAGTGNPPVPGDEPVAKRVRRRRR
jgi:predicted XRE-type DNA-binding protein